MFLSTNSLTVFFLQHENKENRKIVINHVKNRGQKRSTIYTSALTASDPLLATTELASNLDSIASSSWIHKEDTLCCK